MSRAILAVALLLSSAGCVDRWVEARVRDPALVHVSIAERDPAAASPSYGDPIEFRRDPAGALSVSVPDLPAATAETLIDPSGVVRIRPPLAVRRAYSVQGGELRVVADYPGRYLVGGRSTGYDFREPIHVDLRTPMSNVDRVDLHRRPSRAAGALLLAGAAALGGLALTAFEGRSSSPRSLAPAAILGASIAVGATGAVFCLAPDMTRRLVP
jgi:hypothetical protein